jgi:hypothetical protein
MTYDDMPPVMRAAIGAHTAFRRIGFSSDVIFIELAKTPNAPEGHVGVFVTLKRPSPTNPKKTIDYRIAVGFWPKNKKKQQQFMKEWRAIALAVNNGLVSENDLERCWQESEARHHSTEFVLGLVMRGMLPVRSRKITLPDGRIIELEFDAPCVFCGHILSIGTEVANPQKSFIAHGTPTCPKYDELPPDQFLKAANEALAQARKLATN